MTDTTAAPTLDQLQAARQAADDAMTAHLKALSQPDLLAVAAGLVQQPSMVSALATLETVSAAVADLQVKTTIANLVQQARLVSMLIAQKTAQPPA